MFGKSFGVSVAILLVTLLAVVTFAAREVPHVVKTNLENIPLTLDVYKGEEDFFSAGIYEELNADKHVYRHYRSADGKKIDLYIGYYGTAKGGRTGHNPYACLPGAGWAIVDNGWIKIKPEYQTEEVRLNYIQARKDGINNVIIHWYQTAGSKVLATGLEQNIQRFFGRVLDNRNDGAYVQVSSLSNDDQLPAARKQVRMFAEKLLEILPDYWPVEE
jgi:EpsI family protein